MSFLPSRSLVCSSSIASACISALPAGALQSVHPGGVSNSRSVLNGFPCGWSSCSFRHFMSETPNFPAGSTTVRYPGPREVFPPLKDQSLDDDSEMFLRTLKGAHYEKPIPKSPPPPPPNPFSAPTDTFIPLGQSWADAHPTSQSNELAPLPVPGGGVSSSASRTPFIYQSGGFIAANSLSALSLPSGPGTVSGIVATVFGGYGFLGRHLLSYLGRIGAQIIVPYRGDGMNVRRTKLAGDVGQVVPIPYSWDNLDPVVKAIQRSNVIINLLGQRSETPNFSYDDIHVKCTYKIAEIAKKYGNIERFIHVSCIGAHPNSPSSFYRSKGEGENVIRHFFPTATILRCAPMFGLDDYFFTKVGRSIYHNSGTRLFNEGKQRIAPTHVNDVAQAILASIAFGETLGELYHLVGPKVYTALDLVLMAHNAAYADIFTAYQKIKVTHGILSDKFSYWWRSHLHGGRFSHHDSTNTVAYMLVGLVNKLASQFSVHPDQIVQAYVNQTLPEDLPNAKTYKDLNIEPQSVEAHLPRIMLAYRGSRGPERFAEVERKSYTATRPANF